MQESRTLQRPTFVDLNVLPEELRPLQHPAWYVLGVLSVLVATVLLIPLYRVQQAHTAETATLRAELELINEEMGGIQLDFGEARGVRQELEVTEAAIAELNEERQAVLGDGQELSKDLYVAMGLVSAGTHLGSVVGGAGQMTLSGEAPSVADVLGYAGALVESGRFSEARVASLEIGGATGVTFTLEVRR